LVGRKPKYFIVCRDARGCRPPSPLVDAVVARDDYVSVVGAARARAKTGGGRVLVSVRLPEWVVDLLDAVARATASSRSTIIEQAVRRYLDWVGY